MSLSNRTLRRLRLDGSSSGSGPSARRLRFPLSPPRGGVFVCATQDQTQVKTPSVTAHVPIQARFLGRPRHFLPDTASCSTQATSADYTLKASYVPKQTTATDLPIIHRPRRLPGLHQIVHPHCHHRHRHRRLEPPPPTTSLHTARKMFAHKHELPLETLTNEPPPLTC